MTLIAVASAKHSPGATTLAATIAGLTFGLDPLVVEADPAGGDLAARAGLALDPGLLTLAAAGRRGLDPQLVTAHSQRLASGAQVLLAPSSPRHARSALTSLNQQLTSNLNARPGLTVVDIGRLDDHSPASTVAASASAVLLVFKPTVDGVEHLRARLGGMVGSASRVVAVAIGDKPYSPAEIAAVVHTEVLCVANDPRCAAIVGAGAAIDRWLRRTMYVRTVAALVETLSITQSAEAA